MAKRYTRNELSTLPNNTKNGWERLVAVPSSEPGEFYMIARRHETKCGTQWACGCPAWIFQVRSDKAGKGVKGMNPGKQNPVRKPCKHLRQLLNKQYYGQQVGRVFNEEAVGHLLK